MTLPIAIGLLLVPIVAAAGVAEPDQRIRCVAALAIIANDQERGIDTSDAFPPLRSKGARFAGIVGTDLMKEKNMSREAVRDEFIAAVALLQREALAVRDPMPLMRTIGEQCVTLMEKTLPKPGLPECAALTTLAYEDTRNREGFSKTTKDLATFSAVLNSRARDALRAGGKTETQSDIVMGVAKDAMRTERNRPELADCLELAKP